MTDEKKIHEVFAQIWRMFNNVKKDNSDAGWEACVNDADRIAKENPGRMIQKIILAVVDEAEGESKIADAVEKAMRYKAANKAFNEAWELYRSLMTVLDINVLAAYCNDNPGKMAKLLGAAIYEAACGAKNAKGSFMEAAYAFYEKYQDGVKAGAFQEAEDIINRYPEHTLQMMEIYDGLKKRAEAAVSAAA